MKRKIFKFLGTEEDLINNGFKVYSPNYPYEDGGYPVMHRGVRHDVVIYINADENNLRVASGVKVFKAVKQKDLFKDDEVEEYYLKNILYSDFTNTKLYNKYSVSDLIEKGLVVEIDNIIVETDRSKKIRGK